MKGGPPAPPPVVDVVLADSSFKTDLLVDQLEKMKRPTRVRLKLGSADMRWGDCAKIATIIDGRPFCEGGADVFLFASSQSPTQLRCLISLATPSGQRVSRGCAAARLSLPTFSSSTSAFA